MTQPAPHIPVLLDEVIAALAPRPGMTIVDATFGAGSFVTIEYVGAVPEPGSNLTLDCATGFGTAAL